MIYFIAKVLFFLKKISKNIYNKFEKLWNASYYLQSKLNIILDFEKALKTRKKILTKKKTKTEGVT